MLTFTGKNGLDPTFMGNDTGSGTQGGWRSYREENLASGSLGFLGNANYGGGNGNGAPQNNNLNFATMTATFKNESGFIIEALDISYYGEHWREVNGRGSYIFFEYSLNGSDWTDVAAMTFNAIANGSNGARNGDAAAWRSYKSVNLTGLSIANDTEFYLRWSYNGSDIGTGGRQGLAIDDIEVATHMIPEPLSVEMLAVSVGLLMAYRWRRRLVR